MFLRLQVREEEIDLLKARVKNLETELQAALSKPSGKNHEMIENIKQQHEEVRTIINSNKTYDLIHNVIGLFASLCIYDLLLFNFQLQCISI